jgi:hypothetical protein
MTSQPVRPNYRKLAIQMISGGFVGVALSLGTAEMFHREAFAALGGGAFALFSVGMLYAVMGAFVGFGLAFPALGAKLLNVADLEDLSDQRAVLAGGTASCMTLGASLMLAALSGPQGLVPGVVAVCSLVFAILLTGAITVLQWHHYDELLRDVSLETSAVMAGILFPVITIWAVLAHIGQVVPIDPLGLVALMAGTMLFATFVVTGRRGLLMPS